jgi:hypothetical protein
MKYDINYSVVVKEELKKENIDEETINKITTIVDRVLNFNKCRILTLNALKFDRVVNVKNAPLKVLFTSKYDGYDYIIELVNEEDRIIIRDDRGCFEFVFEDDKDTFKIVYSGNNVLVFEGFDINDKTDKDVCEYLKKEFGYAAIRTSVYLYTKSLDLDGLTQDYITSIIKPQKYSNGYVFKDGYSSENEGIDNRVELKNLACVDKCLYFAINFYDWCVEHKIKPLLKIKR